MNSRTSALLQTALFALCILYSLFMAQRMPDVVPTHWGAGGKPDGYGSKWTDLMLMPFIVLAIAGMTLALPKLSPKKFEIEPFGQTYGFIMLMVAVLMSCIHVVIVQTAAGSHLDFGLVFMTLMFLFFAVMGNVLGKVKRNFYMGIRTPWTLADERVWHSTHRYAGRLWLVGGIIGAIASIAGLPLWATITFFVLMAFAPVVKSYFIYRSIDGAGS